MSIVYISFTEFSLELDNKGETLNIKLPVTLGPVPVS